MDRGIHFISGLPRSGSTLLATLLRQNPALVAGMTSPVGGLVQGLLEEMCQRNENAALVNTEQRVGVIRGAVDGYYGAVHSTRTVFDTNRLWTSKLPLLETLWPKSRVVCCVRHVPWIIDSIERLARANPTELSRVWNFDPGGTVYSRSEALANGTGMVGFAWNALREGYWGGQSDRMMLVQYESLVARPQATLDEVYDFVGLPRFVHDPDSVFYDGGDEFDRRIGMPGLHRIDGPVRAIPRTTILPPDLFGKFVNDSFWTVHEMNTNKVRVV